MVGFNINDFKAALTGGGARTSLFNISLTNPIESAGDRKITMTARATAIPEVNNTPIEVFYFGRSIKVAGNRTFQEWQVQIINDEDFVVRNALETWSNAINSFEGNIRGTGSSNPADYKATATVNQYSQTGDLIRAYQFNGLWPVSISAIELDWNNEAIQEYTVQFAIDNYEIVGGITGDAGGK